MRLLKLSLFFLGAAVFMNASLQAAQVACPTKAAVTAAIAEAMKNQKVNKPGDNWDIYVAMPNDPAKDLCAQKFNGKIPFVHANVTPTIDRDKPVTFTLKELKVGVDMDCSYPLFNKAYQGKPLVMKGTVIFFAP